MKTRSPIGVLTRRATVGALLIAVPIASVSAGEEWLGRRNGKRPTSPNLVRWVQKKLNLAGHNAGPADGLMGPKTRSAIRFFQKEKGIEQTGEINRELLSNLGKVRE